MARRFGTAAGGALALAAAALAGGAPATAEEDRRPPLDRETPVVLRTATFALG